MSAPAGPALRPEPGGLLRPYEVDPAQVLPLRQRSKGASIFLRAGGVLSGQSLDPLSGFRVKRGVFASVDLRPHMDGRDQQDLGTRSPSPYGNV